MKKYHLNNKPNREIKSNKEIERILKEGKYTIISMCKDTEPYIVTLSYGYDLKQNALYFHCATKGMKMEFIESNPNVCATVIEDGGYIEDECAHEFKTLVFRGEMKIVEELEEKRYGMNVLLSHLEKKNKVIKDHILKSEKAYSNMAVLRLDIRNIIGKEGR